MMTKKDLQKVTDYLWEIPKSFRSDMYVPARVYTTERMLEEILRDRSLEQAVNVTTLPGLAGPVLVMPDAHEGYGFPIGGVAAMQYPDGVISPGGIGYDINCGVRLLISDFKISEIQDQLERLGRELYREVPSGVGRGGQLKLNNQELEQVLRDGLKWAMAKDYATTEDASRIESEGTLSNADPRVVSEHAKKRGHDQLGTMGAGNHFVEVGRVERTFDEETAKTLGLFADQVTILIHCGSRGLGHQVATDYIRLMLNKLSSYRIQLVDRELACAPYSSPEGTNYFNAMAAAANFAWVNRQLITWEVRKVWKRIFGEEAKLLILYDVAHNIAKIENHTLTSQQKSAVIVHRKGATRAFPQEPVIIPGSMGTFSYVLLGTQGAMRESYGSSCHGAGRRMSRHAAIRAVNGKTLREDLEKQGVYIEAGSLRGLAEEAPIAYKDVDEVVDVVAQAQIAKKVVRLRPVVVIKG